MAWRLHEYVLRGEIDNRTRGRVSGRIWLSGVPDPLELDLSGNCHPDLAGCRLVFENPDPLSFATAPPARSQRGEAGDITAARKVRVYDIPFEDAYAMIKAGGKPPEHMANSLYLEWCSKLNGRVVIESADYRLEISEPAWRFTADELAERARRAGEPAEDFGDGFGEGENWDEFRAEQFLRESDATGDRYRRLLEKYGDHPESERLIAREMGWTWIEEALDAEEAAAKEGRDEEDFEEEEEFDEDAFEEPEPDPALEGIDWVRDDDEGFIHPVAKHAREFFYALQKEVEALGLLEGDVAADEFVSQVMILSVKLRAHLNFLVRGDLHDPALLIAWLKRDMEIHNQALAAAVALDGHAVLPRSRLENYRTELFQIREAVLEILTRLRKGG